MMGSPLVLILLVFLGAAQNKVSGMPESFAEVSQSLSNLKNYEGEIFTALEHKLIPTVDIFLRGLIEKYSSLNDEMEKAIGEYAESSNGAIDCSSPEAIEMRKLKKTFDYCKNMTLEIVELKKIANKLIEALQEVGVSTSEMMSDMYVCIQYPTPVSQATCILQTFLSLQSSFTTQAPKLKMLYAKLLNSYTIIYIDMMQCFYDDSMYSKVIQKIAHYYVRCD